MSATTKHRQALPEARRHVDVAGVIRGEQRRVLAQDTHHTVTRRENGLVSMVSRGATARPDIRLHQRMSNNACVYVILF